MVRGGSRIFFKEGVVSMREFKANVPGPKEWGRGRGG